MRWSPLSGVGAGGPGAVLSTMAPEAAAGMTSRTLWNSASGPKPWKGGAYRGKGPGEQGACGGRGPFMPAAVATGRNHPETVVEMVANWRLLRPHHHAGHPALGQGGAGGLGGLFAHAGEARSVPALGVLDRALGGGELAAEAAVDLGQPVAGHRLVAEGADLDRPAAGGLAHAFADRRPRR